MGGGDCAKVGCGGRSLRSPLWLGEAPVDPSWPGLSFLLLTPIGFLFDWLVRCCGATNREPQSRGWKASAQPVKARP
jgi:hypothetical protein